MDFVAGVLLGFNRPPLGYFAGQFDEIRVWSIAKSAAGVAVGVLDTLPSDADRNRLVYVQSLELYLPNNQVSCAAFDNLCVNEMQKWMVGDDGRLQLMGVASQCLALSSPVVSASVTMQSTACIAANFMRWLPLLESDSMAAPHLLRTVASSFPLVCLSAPRDRPVTLRRCRRCHWLKSLLGPTFPPLAHRLSQTLSPASYPSPPCRFTATRVFARVLLPNLPGPTPPSAASLSAFLSLLLRSSQSAALAPCSPHFFLIPELMRNNLQRH